MQWKGSLSEYELFRQDIANGTFDVNNMDAAQGRVYNVTGADSIEDIRALESEAGFNGIYIDIDKKYARNLETTKAIIENYMKTTSSTFEPKQSDHSFYYSPQIGRVIVAPSGSKIATLDEIAKADGADYATINAGQLIEWINLSLNANIKRTDWNYTNFATETENIYKAYNIDAPKFNIHWTTEDQNGNPLPNASHNIKIENEYHNNECDTPGDMLSVPAGNYALRITDGEGWYYDYNLMVYREGIQRFVLETPSGKITFGTQSETPSINNDNNGGGNNTENENQNQGQNPSVPCTHSNTKIINQKEATTTEEGYTGDTWCNDCSQIIKYGENIEKLPSQNDYTLSGRWVFNSTLTATESISPINLTFTDKFSPYVKMAVSVEERMLPNNRVKKVITLEFFEYGQAIPSTPYSSEYGDEMNWPHGNSITFPTTQTVSKEFYEWFTANAYYDDLEDDLGSGDE